MKLVAALMLLAAPLAAQDSLPPQDSTPAPADTVEFDNNCTFTVNVQKKAGGVTEDGALTLVAGQEASVEIQAAPDSSCVITDGDGTDGSIILGVPSDHLDWDVFARVIGKKGKASVGGVELARVKGKPVWTDVTAVAPATPGSTWTLSAKDAKVFQLRLVEGVALPAE